MHSFWDIRLVIYHDCPVLNRFWEKRKFQSKIANFPTLVYLTPPVKGSPWNWVLAQGVKKASMMGLPEGRKSFKIGLVLDTTLGDRWTDGQTYTLCSKDHAMLCGAWVKSREYSDATQNLQGHFTQRKNITCCKVCAVSQMELSVSAFPLFCVFHHVLVRSHLLQALTHRPYGCS